MLGPRSGEAQRQGRSHPRSLLGCSLAHQRDVTGDDVSNVSPVLLVVWLQEVLSHMESLDEGVNIVRRHPPHSHLLLWVEAAPKFDAELVQKCLHRVFALPVTAADPEIMTPD